MEVEINRTPLHVQGGSMIYKMINLLIIMILDLQAFL